LFIQGALKKMACEKCAGTDGLCPNCGNCQEHCKCNAGEDKKE